MQKQKTLLELLAPSYLVIVLMCFGSLFVYNFNGLRYHIPLTIFPIVIITLVVALIDTLFILNFRLERQMATSDVAKARLTMARIIVGSVLLALPLAIAAGFDFNHWLGSLYFRHGYENSIYSAQSGGISAHQLTFILPGASLFIGLWMLTIGSSKLSSSRSVITALSLVVAVPLLIFGIFFLNFAKNGLH